MRVLGIVGDGLGEMRKWLWEEEEEAAHAWLVEWMETFAFGDRGYEQGKHCAARRPPATCRVEVTRVVDFGECSFGCFWNWCVNTMSF
jgi:hypothetical protein